MTDRLEAARAFVAAGDALNSPEHQADVEKLREISNRVSEREEAFRDAQDALFDADRKAVESGAEPAADNAEAETVLFGGTNGVSPPWPMTPDDDQFSSSRANGAYSED